MKIKLLVSTKVELKGSKVRKLQSGGETIEVTNEVGKKLIDDGRAIDPSKNVVATDNKEAEALKAEIETLKTENEGLKTSIGEKDTEIKTLKAEIETLKKDDSNLLGGGNK